MRSHECDGSLASLSGFIETLSGAGEQRPAGARALLDIMKRRRTAGRPDDDRCRLAKSSSRRTGSTRRRFDLSPIVRQVADGLQTLARDRASRSRSKMPAEPLAVRGDRDGSSVFENRSRTALKRTARPESVEILARTRPEGEAAVAVREERDPAIAPEKSTCRA